MKMPAKVAITLLLVAAIGSTAWVVLARYQTSFRGKSRSFWISSLSETNMVDFGKWRAFGPEAIPILIKALRSRPSPFARVYSRVWSRLPASTHSRLPAPLNYDQIHLRAAALLSDQERGTRIPLEPLASALKDPHFMVRMSVLGCFYKVILPTAGAEKEEILPLLLTAVQDPEMTVRMCAANCLKFYRDQSERVTPVLVRALEDPYPDVRVRAAIALNEVDPSAAAQARAVEVAFSCLKSDGPHGSSALAAEFLQKLGKLPRNENN